MPEGVVNVVTGFGETAGASLAAHPLVDKGRFHRVDRGRQAHRARGGGGNLKKGQPGARRQVAETSSSTTPRLTPWRGAAKRDLLQPRPVLAWPAPGCFVQQSRFDEVVEGRLRDRQVDQARPGHETRTPRWAPLVSDEQLRRVTGYLESGREDGATALTGGGPVGGHRLLRRANRADQHPAPT